MPSNKTVYGLNSKRRAIFLDQFAQAGIQNPRTVYPKVLPQTSSNGADTVTIKNTTGSTVERGQIFAYGAPTTLPATDLEIFFRMPPILNGTQPATGAPGDWGRWAVALRDIEAAKQGPCRISGIAAVELYKPATLQGWDRVDIRNSSHLAQESWFGAASLVGAWNEGDDKRYGLVVLDGWYAPPLRTQVDDASGLPADGSGDCEIIHSDNSETITVYNDWMENGHNFNDDDELLVYFDRLTNHWQIPAGECGT